MVKQIIDYCYSKQLLDEKDLEIYIEDKHILTPVKKVYDTNSINSFIIKGDSLLEKEVLKEITTYDDLKRLGYIVVSDSVRGNERWFRNQRVKYRLVRKSYPGNIGRIPPQHRVMYSTLHKRLRLIGPNAGPRGIGPIIELAPAIKAQKIIKPKKDFLYVRNNRKKVMKNVLGIEDDSDIEYIEIPELPVMLSLRGELICIPPSTDEYVILVVGRRGSGKTYSTASLASRLYWCKGWNKRIILLNDRHDQCTNWALKNSVASQIKILQQIGNLPMPFPLVFLYPKTDTIQDRLLFGGTDSDLSFYMTLPLLEIIQDYKTYLKGNKDWELKGGTAVLFRNMQDDLMGCSTYDEIKSAVARYELDEDDQRLKLSPQSKAKIISTMDDIFSQHIIDTSTGIPASWKLYNRKSREQEDLYPFIALLKANLVPVIKTSDVITKFYYPQYMKFIIDSIFNSQTLNQWFYNNRICIYMVVDEILDIANKKNFQWSVGADSLLKCATQGRPNRIGIVANTQDYTAIPTTIVNQSEYCFCLQLKDQQAKKVGKDYDLSAHQINEIKSLEKFEMLAVTKREFVVYDKQGNRKVTDSEIAHRGYILPPLIQHSTPQSHTKR